jgi:long-chain fatty acid transport protein
MILSVGWAYTGFERWLIACDVRYFDYENTAGFGDPAAFDSTGRVTGLGWKSIVSLHTGAQFRATERLYLRMGYQYNDNPIDSNAAFFNVASPLSIQHVLSTGMSYQLTDNVLLSMAYLHGFEGQSSGPIHVPGVGPVPGTSVTNSVSADAIGAGVTVQY